ncbi:hypothetical protein D3C86_1349890 [compost metagenome]
MIAGLAGEDPDLTVPAAQRPGHQGHARRDAGGVDGEARLEIVGAVQHQVEALDNAGGVGRRQPLDEGLDGDMGIERGQMLSACLDLGPLGVGGGEDDLTLQVGQGDPVMVDQAQGPDPGGGQIEGGGRPNPAQADDQHPCALQRLLAGAADLGQHQLTGIAVDFLIGEADGGERRGRVHPPTSSASSGQRQPVSP